MSSNLPARRSMFGSLSTDRARGKQLAALQEGAFMERAENETQLYLTLGKMSDVGIATRHAFAEGEDMVEDFRSRVGDDPLKAKVLGPILEDSVRDLRRVRRSLSEGF